MIIDVNAHWGPYPFRQIRHHDTTGLLNLLDRNGIDRAVVSANTSVFYRDAHAGNRELAEAVSGTEGRLIPIATIDPTFPGWERDMEQALDDWQMKAVRLAPAHHGYDLDGPEGQRILARMVNRGVPLALHQRLEDRRQQHRWDRAEELSFSSVAGAISRHEGLKVLLLNWLGVDGQQLKEAGLAGRVLVDLTRYPVTLTHAVPKLIDALGIGSVAFGTHMPFNYASPMLVKLEVMNLTEEEREQVAWRNASEFLDL